MPLSDLFNLSSAGLAMPSGGLGESIAATGEYIQRLALALEALVEIERPLSVNQSFILNAGATKTFPCVFVSRVVDIYIPATAVGILVQIQLLDQNGSSSGMPGAIQLHPGDYRSYSVASRGFILTGEGTETHLMYWA